MNKQTKISRTWTVTLTGVSRKHPDDNLTFLEVLIENLLLVIEEVHNSRFKTTLLTIQRGQDEPKATHT